MSSSELTDYIKLYEYMNTLGECHAQLNALYAELAAAREKINALQKNDTFPSDACFDQHASQCGNCGVWMICRGGSGKRKNGLSDPGESEDEALCGACAGEDMYISAADVERLEAVIEADRSKMADIVTAVKQALDSRFWLTEGRGSYEWDDDRYRTEFRDAAIALLAALKPLEALAADLTNSPSTSKAVLQARMDKDKRIAELEAALEQIEETDSPLADQAVEEIHRIAKRVLDRGATKR